MAAFVDKQGLDWVIEMDALLIDAIRADYDPKFMLDDFGQKQTTADRMAADPVLLCHATYLACQRQRDERNVSRDEFYRTVLSDGDTLQSVGDAWESVLANFISPRKRELVQTIAAKQKQVEALTLAKAMARINDPMLVEKIVAQAESKLEAEFRRLLTQPESATDTPASSVSAPED